MNDITCVQNMNKYLYKSIKITVQNENTTLN